MTRVVKVDLILEATKYLRGARESAKATKDVTDSVDDLGAAGGRAEDATEALGDELSELARDARNLDAQIDRTKVGIRDLARQIAATSDAAERAQLSKKLNVERRGLRQMTSVRDLIDVDSAAGAGADLASEVGLSFAARLGPVIARAPMNLGAGGGAVAAIAAPLVAGLTTVVGAALSAAVVGGVGVGGVIGGVALAARDPRVKAAGTALGADLSKVFGRASAAFVPETLGAIDTIRDRVRGMEGDFEQAFSSASRFVDPLVDGLLDAAQNAMPGILDAIDAAGPVIDVVAEAARGLGDAIGDGLSDLAPYADEGARALGLLFDVVEGGVRAVFALAEGLSWLYSQGEILGAILSGNVQDIFRLAGANQVAERSAKDLADGANIAADGILGTGEAARTALPPVQTWADFLDESTGRAFDSERASLRQAAAFRDLGTAAKEGADKGINPNTEAGARNRTALINAAEAAKVNAAAILKTTGNHELAQKATEDARRKFLTAADAMGVEKGEAVALANKLFGIPKNVESNVKANTAGARTAVQSYKSWLASVYLDKTSTIYQRVIKEQYTARGGNREFNRWGGLYENGVRHMALGGVLEAHVTRQPTVIYGERETGGEAFIPRNGDMARSRAIWSHVGQNWLGMRPAGGATVVNHYSLSVAPGVVGSQFELEQWLVGALDSLKRQART